jgi:hypothetical protein
MLVHLLLGILSFLLVYLRFSQSDLYHDLTLLAVAIFCSFLPDIDHFIYIFTYGKDSEYGSEANQLIKSGQWTELKLYAKTKHKELTGLFSHNIGMAFISLFLFFLFTYFLHKPISAVASLAIFSHFLYDIVEDKVLLGKLNPNWTFRFNDREWKLFKILGSFFKLIRLYSNAVTSLPLVFGYIAAKSYSLSTKEEMFIVLSYLIFSPLMYGGIYILSSLRKDASDELLLPEKNLHLITSEQISVRSAKAIAFTLISLSLFLGHLLSKQFFCFQLLFIIINFSNLLFIRKVPFINILSSASTHPLRIVAGIVLAGGSILHFSDLIITHSLYNISTASVRNKRAFPLKEGVKYLTLLQYLCLILLIVHFLITLDSPALIFRIPFVLISAFALPLYKKSRVAKNIINQWYYGKSF